MKKLTLHLLGSLQYSLNGLKAAFRHEFTFRLELLLTIVIVPLACWLGDDAFERALLIASWLLVLVVEMLNSAIETVIDRISLEHHELSGRAKDYGSAAVLLACLVAATLWVAKIVLLW